MRLVAKMATSLAGLALLAMAGEAWFDQRRRADLLEMDTLKDWRMGRVLQANAETLWRVGGEQDARLVIETTDRSLPHRMIRFVALDELEPVDLRSELPWTRQREDVAWRYLPGEVGSQMRYIYIPLAPDGTVRAAIVVGESLAPIDAHMRERLKGKAAAGLTVAGLSGLLAVLLGTWLVDRPVSSLRETVRALADGREPPPMRHAGRDELGELAAELRTVGERLATRERLRHADRLRTIGQLSSGVAHELGAPLSVVGLRAGMIASGEATGDEARRNGTVIVEQVERMTRLVRQLLDYSRRQGSQASLIDVRQIAATTLDMLKPLAAKRGVTLEIGKPEEALLVHADPVQLQQVVTNLAMNGIQAMTPGGTLRVAVGRRHDRPPGGASRASNDWVWVQVGDDGPGIDPEHLPHLFEPFYTTKAVGEGTGLGLAVAQAIVEEHEGWIEVASELGAGSRFTVYLADAAVAEERLAS